ncbi:fibulin 1/2 [Sarotherodon galilaeus]
MLCYYWLFKIILNFNPGFNMEPIKRSVNGGETRICALKGSSVDLHCSHQHLTSSSKWFTIDWDGSKYVQSELSVDGQRVTYNMSEEKNPALTINVLRESDANTYCCMKTTDSRVLCSLNEITLQVVAGTLRVEMSPSAVVTEGQRVTLTCSTSCPLTDNTNYIWYLNSRPLTPRENQNKHLILDPVSRENAGSYSCAVKTNKDISSAPKTLTVQSITGTWTPAAAGVSAALLLLILLTVCWWKGNFRQQTAGTKQDSNKNDSTSMNPDVMYESAEQDDHHYSRLHFSDNHTADLYSTIEPLPAH